MRVARVILAAVVVLVIALPALAQEKPREKGRRGGGGMLAGQLRLVESLDLTADQKAKLEALKKEFTPKMEEAMKARQGILTEEQRRPFYQAMNAARKAGKQNQEAFEEACKEAKVTDEQKAKLAESEKKGAELRKEVNDKVSEILTPEQREQLKKKMEEFRGKARAKAEEKK